MQHTIVKAGDDENLNGDRDMCYSRENIQYF